MIKVLHVVLGLQVGGLEKFVIDLINGYAADVQSFVVCLEDEGELAASCNSAGLYALHKKPGISPGVIKQIYTLARELRIDLIHTHNPSPHLHGAFAGLLAGIPVVHTKHGRNQALGARKIILYRLSALLTRKVVAVSQSADDECISLEGIPAGKVLVIRNGIAVSSFTPSARPAEPADMVTIGIVARLAQEKDHLTLLRACKLLSDRQTPFRLVIIGDGSLRGELELAASDLNLSGQVEFAGVRHDIPDQLQRLDIFALSSTTEGISLTLLEAMASGLPVVATDVGGNPEVVVDGTTGFIVPPANPEAMAEKLELLIQDRSLRERMGAAGRKRVEEHFDIRQTARQYEELYREVLGET
jgi:sugar transferase (PEP-CTERM/EpsH1 system associated)